MTSTHTTTAASRSPASTPRPAVAITGVRRIYPGRRDTPARIALDGVSLSVPEGQRIALLGPNGSGKSTLLRIIATLDRPDEGRVELLDQPLARAALRTIRARLGIVFQDPGLDPLLTVRENLAAAASLYGLSGPRRTERIDWAAARLTLADRLNDRVGTLSGGLARRTDLARALLHTPDLLLLDEPTTGLDPRARAEFLALIRDIAAERAASGHPLTVIMSTHLMEEAEAADRVVLLHAGRIVADAAPDALRATAGGRVIRVPIDAAGVAAEAAHAAFAAAGLEAHTIDTTAQRPTALIATVHNADPAAVERAILALTRAELPFEVSAPTLGDVFLALTGADLAPATSDANTSLNGRRRRRGRRH